MNIFNNHDDICRKLRPLLASSLRDQLSKNERNIMEQHLQQCPQCATVYESMKAVWTQLDELIVPPPSLNLNRIPEFNNPLSLTPEFFNEYVKRLWRWQPRIPLAYLMLGAIIVGAAIVFFMKDLQVAKNDDQFSVIQQPLATERMKAIRVASETTHPDKQVIMALAQTLNTDPNTNVRLRALDVLATKTEDPKVREILVASIAHQESPLIQLALAELMMQLAERRAVTPFKALRHRPDLEPDVRKQLDTVISKLI